MSKGKVVAALSGGVDSSVVAALLLEQGYEVIGATLDTGQGAAALRDAAAVCAQMGIRHHVLDVRAAFQDRVVRQFCAAYQAGQTPNPCVICNPTLKFPSFLPLLEELGCDYLATGHYVRLREQDGRYLLYQALDKRKDQSYFLYMLPQRILARCLFPLGDYADKNATRAKARALALEVAEKADSQDICFIPDGDYRAFLRARGVESAPGELVDLSGKPLGRHAGLAYYTIGQRKGLGLALGYPAYVVGINQERNQLVVGREEDLYTRHACCKEACFLPFDELTAPRACQVKVRYKAAPQDARIAALAAGGVRIEFAAPTRAVTPGQAAVFYEGEQVLGGGTLV